MIYSNFSFSFYYKYNFIIQRKIIEKKIVSHFNDLLESRIQIFPFSFSFSFSFRNHKAISIEILCTKLVSNIQQATKTFLSFLFYKPQKNLFFFFNLQLFLICRHTKRIQKQKKNKSFNVCVLCIRINILHFLFFFASVSII